MYMYIYIHIFMCAYLYVCMCNCTCMPKYLCIQINKCKNIRTNMHKYINL